jgi:uncharacterized PurR-regulated membrane protein YhhQ (DUF165 family)
MIILYLIAIIAANLSVAYFGPSAVVVNAFVFIALDLVTRDALHDRWQGRRLVWRMAALIATGSLLSWLLNRDAGPIALASFLAFAAAATVDGLVYAALKDRTWFVRSNVSNVFGATVDSAVFLSVAGLPLFLMPLQVVAKIGGGILWSVVLRRSPFVSARSTGIVVGGQE